MKPRHKNHKGFSLAEALIATTILSMAAAGVLLPFTSGASVQAEGNRQTLASSLASELMETIVSTPFDQIISDYSSCTESMGGMENGLGVKYTAANYDGVSRQATCQYVYVPQENGLVSPQFILATVRVYYNNKEVAVLNRLIRG